MKPCRKAKLAPCFRHLGGEFKSPSFVHGRRAAFLYHSVPPLMSIHFWRDFVAQA